MGDDADREALERFQQRRHVEDVVDHGIRAADRPCRIAVAAEVGCDDVEGAAELSGDPVPAPAVVPPAVQEQQRGVLDIAPIHVVELQPLRVEVVRCGSEELGFRDHGRRSSTLRAI